ncbi:NfeD family protein [Neisseria subflava]|uniref:NfeD family protein n=1 Tax=Neisseria subflava TaxID=28449 RepID=UPI00202A869C|nr:NfeD family protein [Neisseria subflava]MCL9778576.1 NfeD family protein [Neisseria subflava]UTG76459.1 NfeD family protein [Neisseria subflava]
MTIWFVAAAVVLIVELFIGTVYLLVVSVALAAAGIMYGLSGHFSAAVLTAAIISALGIWLVHGRLKNQLAPQALNDDLDIGQNVHILRHLHDNIYEVAYRGTHWQAQAERPQDTFQTASSAVITAKNGNLLIIRTLSQPSS